MINWRNKATPGPRGDLPNTDWIDAIYFALYTNSAFIKLMNPNHPQQPDSRKTASEVRAVNEICHGVSVDVDMEPGYRRVGPNEHIEVGDEFFTTADTWCACVQSLGFTPAFYTNRSIVRRPITDVLALHTILKRTNDALELMTAGRDQDRRENTETIAFQEQSIEQLDQLRLALQAGNDRLKQQRNEARAEVYALRTQIEQLRQETFPQSLDNVRLESELQCAIKQRDEMKEHADRNRAGRVTAENHIRRLQEEIRALNRQQVNQPIQMLPDIGVSITANLVQQRDTLINDLKAELKASTGRNKECIEQREHAIKRWRDDNRLAEQRLVRIRELESEISQLGKLLQGLPVCFAGLRACVDGKFYTIDDLCKEFSALKELHRSTTESFEKNNVRAGTHIQELLCKNADLCADVANLRIEAKQNREIASANEVRLHNALQGEWRRGFNDGSERVMKYVSKFSQEIGAGIAQRTQNQNPS